MEKEDLRVKKTRRNIHKSFMYLFYNYDFEKITVKNIAEQAEIGRKTFYLHYLDKYDLVDKIVKEMFDELEEICEQKKGTGLKKGSQIWFDYFDEHRVFFTRLFKIPNSSDYKNQLKRLIVHQLTENVDKNRIEKHGLDFTLFLRFFANGVIELLDIYLSEEKYTKEHIINQIVPLLDEIYK